MTTETMSPALASFADLVHAKVGFDPPRFPTRAPSPGQTREQWLAEVEAVRAEGDRLAGIVIEHLELPTPEVAAVLDGAIPVGEASVPGRIYVPNGSGPFPALVYFHGGAWWLAGGERGFALNDSHCRILCAEAGAIVVTVDYRLAPEFPFPVQLEDAFRAVAWAQGGAELDADPERVSVAGTSSGANLAAAVCILARDRGGPPIRSQILHVPALDLTLQSPSIHEDGDTARHLDAVIDLYVAREHRAEAIVSPLLADDLGGLPPAFIATGRYDPLRDDGRRYAERLVEHGTPATCVEYPMFHGIGLPETMRAMYADMAEALRVTHSG